VPGYSSIIGSLKKRYGIRIRRWRQNMSGCAWRVYYPDGRILNWIESPKPKTPISLAIFLHEVGHHVIGFDRYGHSFEEEYHAWKWALREMSRLGIEPDSRTLRRFDRSMRYAVEKARRRGLADFAPEFSGFMALETISTSSPI
jgi:hypothetical protein